MPIERPLSVFVITLYVLAVSVCEIITFEIPVILDSNPWSLKWRSRLLRIWMKIGMFHMNLHMCTKMGASSSSQFLTVHNHPSISWQTDGRTQVLHASHFFTVHNHTFHDRRTDASTACQDTPFNAVWKVVKSNVLVLWWKAPRAFPQWPSWSPTDKWALS